MPTSVQIVLAIVDAERGVRREVTRVESDGLGPARTFAGGNGNPLGVPIKLSVSSSDEREIDGLRFAVDAWDRLHLRASGETTVERLGRVWHLQPGGSVVVLDGDVIVSASGRRCIRVLGTWRVSERSRPRNEVRPRPLGAAWLAAFLGLVTPTLAVPLAVAADVPTTLAVNPSAPSSRAKKARTPDAPSSSPGFGKVVGQIRLQPTNVELHQFSVSLSGPDYPPQSAAADETGHFVFEHVPAGAGYELRVIPPALTQVEGTLAIGADAHTLADLMATLDVRAGATTEAVLSLQANKAPIEVGGFSGEIVLPPRTILSWPSYLVRRPLAPWAGMIEVRSGIAVDLGAGHVAKPLNIPLSLGYGLTDRTSLALFSEGGLCLHGDGRCDHIVNDVVAELMRVLVASRRGLQLGARAGVGLMGFSPNLAVARAGFVARFADYEWAVQFDPLLQIAANQREQNPDVLRLPVTVQIQLGHATAFARGAWEGRRGADSTSVVPVAAGLVAASSSFDLGLQFAFPRVAGSEATLSERNLMLFFAYRWAKVKERPERTRYWDDDLDEEWAGL